MKVYVNLDATEKDVELRVFSGEFGISINLTSTALYVDIELSDDEALKLAKKLLEELGYYDVLDKLAKASPRKVVK